ARDERTHGEVARRDLEQLALASLAIALLAMAAEAGAAEDAAADLEQFRRGRWRGGGRLVPGSEGARRDRGRPGSEGEGRDGERGCAHHFAWQVRHRSSLTVTSNCHKKRACAACGLWQEEQANSTPGLRGCGRLRVGCESP